MSDGCLISMVTLGLLTRGTSTKSYNVATLGDKWLPLLTASRELTIFPQTKIVSLVFRCRGLRARIRSFGDIRYNDGTKK